MKFSVKFEVEGFGYLIHLPEKEIGLAKLHEVREILDVPELDLARVTNHITSKYSSGETVLLSEQEASASKLFQDVNTVVVQCSEKSFTKYCTVKTDIRKTNNGEILYINFYYAFTEKKAVIKDWAEAGYPLNWEVEQV